MENTLTCPDCGKFAMRTEQDALICPDGHGRVIGTMGAIEYGVAHRRHRLEQWLDTMPCALQEKDGRAFTVSGMKGLYKRAPVIPDGMRDGKPKRRSELKVGQQAPAGFFAARIGDRGYVFCLAESQPKPQKRTKQTA